MTLFELERQAARPALHQVEVRRRPGCQAPARDVTQRRKKLFELGFRAEELPERLHGRLRRSGREATDREETVRRVRSKSLPRCDDAVHRRPRPGEHEVRGGSDRMDAEAEARDDPEVAASPAAAGPVEIGVRVSIAREHPPVGGHDLSCEDVVRRRSELARGKSDASAESEPTDPDRRAGAGRDGRAALRQPRVDVDQQGPGADRGPLCLSVHGDAVEGAHVDHEPVLDGRVTRVAVTSRASTDADAMPSRPQDRLPHVGGAGGAHHGQRSYTVETLVEGNTSARIRSARAADNGTVDEPRQLA